MPNTWGWLFAYYQAPVYTYIFDDANLNGNFSSHYQILMLLSHSRWWHHPAALLSQLPLWRYCGVHHRKSKHHTAPTKGFRWQLSHQSIDIIYTFNLFMYAQSVIFEPHKFTIISAKDGLPCSYPVRQWQFSGTCSLSLDLWCTLYFASARAQGLVHSAVHACAVLCDTSGISLGELAVPIRERFWLGTGRMPQK